MAGAAQAEGFGHQASGDIVYEACAFGVGLQHVDGLLQLEQAGINQDRSGLAAFAENVDGRYRACDGLADMAAETLPAVSISGGPTAFCNPPRMRVMDIEVPPKPKSRNHHLD